MNTRRVIRNILLTVLFLLALYASGRYLGHVLYPKMGLDLGIQDDKLLSEDYSVYYFGKTKPDTVDTVFVGNSHQFCSINVNILNHEYGWNSIMLASRSQNLKLSYYAILEAIELQHPKTIILESYAAVSCGEEPDALAKISFFSYMPNRLRSKWEAIQSTGDAPYLYYYPLTALHGNWGDIRLKDFRFLPKLKSGERYHYTFQKVTPQKEWEVLQPDVKGVLREESLRWLQKIVDLCKENDLELILYTAPYTSGPEDQTEFNTIADFARENGILYLNLMYCMDEMQISLDTDFMDYGHLNVWGQEKLTRYFAETIERYRATF